MDETLGKELLAVVEANLPKATSEALQKRLRLVDELEVQNKKITTERDKLRDEVLDLRSASGRVADLDRELRAQAKSLAERETAIAERESKVLHAELRIHGAESKAAAVYELASIVFRNPRLVTRVTEETDKNVPRGPNDFTTLVTDRRTTTTEQVEQ